MNSFGRMRVLYINHTGQVSGAERVLLDMIKGLDRRYYEPFVACPADGRLTRAVTAEDVPCVEIPQVRARFGWRLSQLWQAARTISQAVVAVRRTVAYLKPDIVHANTLRAGIVVSLATAGMSRPSIWHVHDTLPRHPFSSAIRFLAFLSRRTQIVTVSDAVAKAFRGLFPFGGKVNTIYNGTDLAQFPLKAYGDRDFRSTIGVPDNAFLVCAVGQICARKGLVELVRAFQGIRQLAPTMHLVIAGKVVFDHEQEYFETLRHVAATPELKGRVHLIGEIRNTSALLRAADLLVLNSLDEPFGLVLIEAMSSGTPVLTTRTGGIPEIVEDARTGWLVEPGDTAGLAGRLLQLSQNRVLLDAAAMTARLETCPRFSSERFRAELKKLYERVVPTTTRQRHTPNPHELGSLVRCQVNAKSSTEHDFKTKFLE
ncbi:glycosyltransferase family 4 protein [Terriglobus sp. 2YAB30_2]|uniref:glycosyltransferase family 4 protein n=3 Tax=unclassified Terriglobus TaxID=2628988 RepID=UPI003F988D43